jgi:3-oxoacyl-[acyl-carrier-protein] synthase II
MSTTVVVTGLGATTPLGGDVASSWARLLEARPGVVALEAPWAEQLTCRIAAPLAVEPLDSGMDRVEARRLDRCEQVALIAAREAWADAGRPEAEPHRIGVVVGTGVGGVSSLLDQWQVLQERGPRACPP